MKTTITVGDGVSVEVEPRRSIMSVSMAGGKEPQPDTWVALSEMGRRAFEVIQKEEAHWAIIILWGHDHLVGDIGRRIR